jgi:hypothetical protein
VKALDRLSKKLGRLQFHPPEAVVFVDGERVSSREWYVTPGSHVVKLVLDGYEDQQTVAIEAGGARSLSALPPPAPPASASPGSPAPSEARPDAAPPSSGPAPDTTVAASGPSTGWSPVVFVAGAALTVVASAVAVGFGVDTLNERAEFDASPSAARFDAGQAKQTRTNVAIGVAAGLGVLTAVTGLWLVDWSGKRSDRERRVGLAVSPSFVGVSGAFD